MKFLRLGAISIFAAVWMLILWRCFSVAPTDREFINSELARRVSMQERISNGLRPLP